MILKQNLFPKLIIMSVVVAFLISVFILPVSSDDGDSTYQELPNLQYAFDIYKGNDESNHYILPILSPRMTTFIQNKRNGRSEVAKSVLNGGLYSIQNVENSLYLTAKRGRTTHIGPVISKKWQNAPAQLWEVTQLDTANRFSLKPLHNEFNSITSLFKDNAHAYHAWQFKNVRKGDKNLWMIFFLVQNQHICIQSNGYMKPVERAVCEPSKQSQLWELRMFE